MSARIITFPARRELAQRRANGIEVTLWWSPADDALAVTVVDESGESFELVVEPDEAVDVYEHPYAYAAFRGLHDILDVAA
jgi:hypothetical protein